MKLTPTNEQKNILKHAAQMDACETLTVTAFAGAAKTSTLIMLAEAMPSETFLYLAFNKAIVEEAKSRFPSNVVIKTTHSLAYPYTVDKRRVRNNYRAAEIAEMYRLQFDEASHVLSVFDFYCNSAIQDINQLATDSSILQVVGDIYDRMKNKEMDITHSWYLKEFQLSLLAGLKIRIPCTYALLDEAQDTNSVTLSIFNNLPGKKIKVGDPHQAIYGFRGAIDGMNDRGGQKGKQVRKSLTTTFRCLPHIVDQANWLLSTFKREKELIVSGNNSDPEIKSTAILSRTNSTLIEHMDELADFNLTRTPDVIFESVLSVLNWKYGFNDAISKPLKFLLRFKTMQELTEYVEATDDQELRQALKLLDKYDCSEWTTKGFPYGKKIRQLYNKAVECYSFNGSSSVTLSSAHSAKGLEFDKVIITSDFPDMINVISKLMEKKLVELPEDFTKGSKPEIVAAREEVNLYYVATTRARFELSDHSPTSDLYKQSKTLYEVFEEARKQASQFGWKSSA